MMPGLRRMRRYLIGKKKRRRCWTHADGGAGCPRHSRRVHRSLEGVRGRAHALFLIQMVVESLHTKACGAETLCWVTGQAGECDGPSHSGRVSMRGTGHGMLRILTRIWRVQLGHGGFCLGDGQEKERKIA